MCIRDRYWQDSLKLIVGTSHPLFGKKDCSFSDVQNDLYITKKKQSSQYKFLDHIFRQYQVDFPNKLFISTQDAIKEAVVNNVGISIMSELAVEREVNAGLITAPVSYTHLDVYKRQAEERPSILSKPALPLWEIWFRISSPCPPGQTLCVPRPSLRT